MTVSGASEPRAPSGDLRAASIDSEQDSLDGAQVTGQHHVFRSLDEGLERNSEWTMSTWAERSF